LIIVAGVSHANPSPVPHRRARSIPCRGARLRRDEDGNKANLNESSAHKPTLADAVLVQVIAGDTRLVQAMAYTLGGVFVKLPTVSIISDVALLEMVAEISIQNGRFHGELKEAIGDGKFSGDEHQAIKERALTYIAAILEAVGRIEGLVDA
jgi:hypothetical protein